MNKKQNGITIVTLVITVIVLIIITSATVYTGTNVIKQATLQTINTNMMLIQAKTKTIAEQAKFNKDTNLYKGTQIKDISDNSKINQLVNDEIIDDVEKFYLLSSEDLNTMGLEKINIDDGYVVNYETEEIIYVRGFVNGDRTYYKLSEMKNISIQE